MWLALHESQPLLHLRTCGGCSAQSVVYDPIWVYPLPLIIFQLCRWFHLWFMEVLHTVNSPLVGLPLLGPRSLRVCRFLLIHPLLLWWVLLRCRGVLRVVMPVWKRMWCASGTFLTMSTRGTRVRSMDVLLVERCLLNEEELRARPQCRQWNPQVSPLPLVPHRRVGVASRCNGKQSWQIAVVPLISTRLGNCKVPKRRCCMRIRRQIHVIWCGDNGFSLMWMHSMRFAWGSTESVVELMVTFPSSSRCSLVKNSFWNARLSWWRRLPTHLHGSLETLWKGSSQRCSRASQIHRLFMMSQKSLWRMEVN